MTYAIEGNWLGLDWNAVAAIATLLTVILASIAACIAWFQFRAFRSEARLSRRPVLAIEIERVKIVNAMRSRGDGSFYPLYQRNIEIALTNIGEGMALDIEVLGRITYFESVHVDGDEIDPRTTPTHRGRANTLRAGDTANVVLQGPEFPTRTPEPGRYGRVQVVAVCQDVYNEKHPMPNPVTWAVDFSRGEQPATLRDAEAADLSTFD